MKFHIRVQKKIKKHPHSLRIILSQLCNPLPNVRLYWGQFSNERHALPAAALVTLARGFAQLQWRPMEQNSVTALCSYKTGKMQLSSVHMCLCVRLPAVGEGPEGETEGSHIRGFRADKWKGGPFLDRDYGLGWKTYEWGDAPSLFFFYLSHTVATSPRVFTSIQDEKK